VALLHSHQGQVQDGATWYQVLKKFLLKTLQQAHMLDRPCSLHKLCAERVARLSCNCRHSVRQQ
jgi:hypothetical protein